MSVSSPRALAAGLVAALGYVTTALATERDRALATEDSEAALGHAIALWFGEVPRAAKQRWAKLSRWHRGHARQRMSNSDDTGLWRASYSGRRELSLDGSPRPAGKRNWNDWS